MTKFVAYYNVCPIHDPKEFLGISPDSTEGNIITTLDRNIIIIIKISTQKHMKSWSVTEKLTTKVVFDKQSQRYVGVFGGRALRCWDESCEDVNKCKKLKFKKSIADLVTADDKVYVLFNDGTCEVLAQAIESRKEQLVENQSLMPLNSQHITNARAFKLKNGLSYLTYFERLETGDLQLVHLTLDDKRGYDSVSYKISRPDQPHFEIKPSGCAVIEAEDTLMLMSIWSDNSIFMLRIDNSVDPKTSPGKFVARMPALKVNNKIAVLGISPNVVAIYGANSTQEGASLLLYNTKFQVIKTKQFFKVYLDFSRLWSVGEYILLAMGQNLSVVTYRQSPDLISDLLGTQATNSFENCIEIEHLNEEADMEDNIQFADSKSLEDNLKTNKETFTQNENTEEETFADGKKIPYKSVSDFDQTLSLLSRLEMSTKVVEVEDALEDVQISLMANYNDSGFVTSEVELIAQQLEACGASEIEITEKLLTLLTRANLLADIIVCLRRYSNISDKMLAKLLKYVVKLFPDQVSNVSVMKTDDSSSEEKSILQKSPIVLRYILEAIFACNFSSENIALHLRHEIDYEAVILLMGYIYDLLEDSAESTIPTRPVAQGSVFDDLNFEMQLIRWFSVLLSSHFQKLVLSRDINLMELLYKWHHLCANYTSLMDDLNETSALLYNLVAKKQLSHEVVSKYYTIEEVDLW